MIERVSLSPWLGSFPKYRLIETDGLKNACADLLWDMTGKNARSRSASRFLRSGLRGTSGHVMSTKSLTMWKCFAACARMRLLTSRIAVSNAKITFWGSEESLTCAPSSRYEKILSLISWGRVLKVVLFISALEGQNELV